MQLACGAEFQFSEWSLIKSFMFQVEATQLMIPVVLDI